MIGTWKNYRVLWDVLKRTEEVNGQCSIVYRFEILGKEKMMLASRKEKELEYRLWWIQSGDQEDGLEYLDVNCWGGPAENQVQDISSLVWWGAAVECQVKTCKKRDKAGGLDLVSADVKVPKRVREVTSVGQLSYWKMSSLLKRTYYIFRQSDGSPVCIDVQTAWQKKKTFSAVCPFSIFVLAGA